MKLRIFVSLVLALTLSSTTSAAVQPTPMIPYKLTPEELAGAQILINAHWTENPLVRTFLPKVMTVPMQYATWKSGEQFALFQMKLNIQGCQCTALVSREQTAGRKDLGAFAIAAAHQTASQLEECYWSKVNSVTGSVMGSLMPEVPAIRNIAWALGLDFENGMRLTAITLNANVGGSMVTVIVEAKDLGVYPSPEAFGKRGGEKLLAELRKKAGRTKPSV